MLQYAKNLNFTGFGNMEEVSLESFLQNSAIDKPMAIKKGSEEICKAINNEDLLIELIVPNMGACNLEQQGESLEQMQVKAQKIAQDIKMDC